MPITVTSGNSLQAGLTASSGTSAATTDAGSSLFAALFANTGQTTSDLLSSLTDGKNLPPELASLLSSAKVQGKTDLKPLVDQALQNTADPSNPRLALAADSNTDATQPQDAVADVLEQLGLRSQGETGKTAASDSKRKSQTGTETTDAGIAMVVPAQAPVVQTPQTEVAASSDTSTDAILADSTPAKSAGLLLQEQDEREKTLTTDTPATPHSAFQEALQAAKPASTASASAEAAQQRITASVHDQQAWPKQLGDRVVWMNQQGQQTAEIHLNPSHLGPLQITLDLSNGNTNATFVSAHSEVRQAIQDALPQLRDMFAGAGISLGQANVNAQTQQQSQQQAQQQAASDMPRYTNDAAILRSETEGPTVTRVTPIRQGNGTVDLFA